MKANDGKARSLFGLAWPIFISNQLGQLYQLVATFWIGKLTGTLGLAVIALVRPLVLVMGRVFAVVAAGAGSEIARDIGAKRGRAGALLRDALVAQAFVAVPLCLVGVAIASPLARALAGNSTDTYNVLRWFLVPACLTFPISAAVEVILSAVIATRWTRLTLWRIIAMLALQFALTPLCIAGLDLGVVGAPIAELVAELTCLVLIALLLRKVAVKLGLDGWTTGWSLGVRGLRRFAAIGGPPELARILSFSVLVLLTQRLTSRGDAALAAMALAMQTIYLVIAATWSLGGATGVLVGQSIGAGDAARARGTIRVAFTAALAIGAVLWLVIPFLRPVIGLVSDDPIVLDKTMELLGLMRWGLVLTGCWQVLAASYVAVGRSGWTGLFMAISDVVGGVVGVSTGDPVRGVGWWFITSNVLKLVLLMTLLQPLLGDRVDPKPPRDL